MESQGIARVVCLLDDVQLTYYGALPEGLISRYQEAFGAANVLSAPIKDYHLSTAGNLAEIMAFLDESRNAGMRTVIHCSGGMGRTGHVLAAWLVHAHHYTPSEAIETVRNIGPIRNPGEAVDSEEATQEELFNLLESVSLPSARAS
jgi:protein-tyrosine phosphatase